MALNGPFLWTLKWLLEPNEWSYNEDGKDRRTIMGWPLNDIPQRRPLLPMLRHFEFKSDSFSICNVKFPWSFYYHNPSLKWSPEFSFWKSLVTSPNMPPIAITEKKNFSLPLKKTEIWTKSSPLCLSESWVLWPPYSFLQCISMVIVTQDYDPIITKSIKLKLYSIITNITS